MDDDTIPRPDCLEKLLEAVSETADAGFVCSRVVDPQGQSTNVPIPDYRRGETLNPEWEKFLDRGLVKVRQCTFVSVLVPRETVALVGFPVAEMFIWGDDIEYTYRITDHRPGYLAGRSVAVHKRVNPAPPRIFRETDRARIRLHYYNFRNQTYLIKRFRARREKFFTAWALLANCLRSLASPPHRFLKFSTALRGIVAGLFFRPDPTGGFKKP
jgi:dTDP-4-dehydrorhamnose reductase